MKVAELRAILMHLQHVYAAAGAKAPAKDFQIIVGLLDSHVDAAVSNFVAQVSANLNADQNKPRTRKMPAAVAASNETAIAQHVARLRDAGAEQGSFDAAFAAMTSDRFLKLADVAEIARRYANSVTKYRSLDAARKDIAAAFVRRARFENKLQ